MSSVKYRISYRAIQDLEEIWFYTSKKWSITQADEYHMLIIDTIEFAADNIKAGKYIKTTQENYRVLKVKSHLVFCRRGSGDVIEIVRILHKRMEFKSKLGT